jgi:ligand-binding sensor domain-containing protein
VRIISRKYVYVFAGAVVVCGGFIGGRALWQATRALHASESEYTARTYLRFASIALDGALPAGFESIAAPGSFADAAVLGDDIYIAGSGGLFEYDRDGVLKHRYRAGLELPPAPIVQIASGLIAGATTPELWMATDGQGAIEFDGSHFRQVLPDDPAGRRMTSVLPLATGRILFGTANNGVLAYDGKQLTPFHASLAGVAVTRLAGDESNLWIGTLNQGVLDLHAGRLDRFAEAQGLPDRRVLALLVDGATAYAGTAMGIAEIRNGKIQRVLAPGYTVRTLEKRGSTLLAGTLDEGLIAIPLVARIQAASRSVACADCDVRRLFTVGDAQFALTDTGLFRTDRHAAEWSPVLDRAQAVLANRNISALAGDSTGRLWIGYFDRGLDLLDAARTRTIHVEDQHVFCVNRIVCDPARGRIAVATANGLVMFDNGGSERQVIGRREGLIANSVTDVLMRPDGTMVASTPAGVSFIEPGGISSIYAFEGLINNHVYALAESGPRLLVGTLGGLSVLNAGAVAASFTTANSMLRHNWITSIARVDNAWFIGTYGAGVMQFDGTGRWENFPDLPRNFEVNENAMLVTDRAVYAGSLDRGLAVYNRTGGRWQWVTRGLPSENVTALAAMGGFIYIGTQNGLVRVPEGNLVH